MSNIFNNDPQRHFENKDQPLKKIRVHLIKKRKMSGR